MRHGKPSLPPQQSITSLNFKHWIDTYDSAELCEKLKPESGSIEIAKSCNVVLCSNLKRSVSSARFLGIKEVNSVDYDLREMEMPWGNIAKLKIKPKYWALIFRTLWFFGYSRNSESFKEAKLRAAHAASVLECSARESGNVLFLGHGMLNRYIANSLVEKDWLVKKKIGSNYWEFGVFEREA